MGGGPAWRTHVKKKKKEKNFPGNLLEKHPKLRALNKNLSSFSVLPESSCTGKKSSGVQDSSDGTPAMKPRRPPPMRGQGL